MDREIWLQQRRAVLGASDVPKVLGVSTWGGPHDVYADKVLQRPESNRSEASEWGNVTEPRIIEKYAKMHTDRHVVANVAELHYHPTIPWAACTPDGFADDDRCLEAKLRSVSKGWGYAGTDDIPEGILFQSLWQLMVTGRQQCDVIALFHGTRYVEYEVHRNPTLEAWVWEECTKFWETHIEGRVAPVPDGSDGAKSMLGLLHPKANGAIITVDQSLEAKLAALVARRDTIKQLTRAQDLATQEIEALIGDNTGIQTEGFEAKWVNQQGRVSWKKMVDAFHPSKKLQDKFRGSGYRQLQCNPRKAS